MLHAGRQRDGRQLIAVAEGVVSDGFQVLAQGDLPQGAVLKGAVADGGHGVGEGQGGDGRAGKGLAAHGLQASVQGDGFQISAAGEVVSPQRLQAAGDVKGGQPLAAGEHLPAEISQVRRQPDGGQAGAAVEGAAPDLSQRIGQGHPLQLLAEHEAARAHSGDAAAHRGRTDLALEAEPGRIEELVVLHLAAAGEGQLAGALIEAPGDVVPPGPAVRGRRDRREISRQQAERQRQAEQGPPGLFHCDPFLSVG